MCKTKTSADVVAPTTPRPHSHQSSSKPNSKSKSSSSSSSSSVNFTTNWSNSKSSAASRSSLASLRDSLPESPHIYDFSEIRAATNNFLSKKSSSSSSWRSTIRGRDVIIFQRKLRRALELDQLCERLSLICRSHHSSIISLLGASVSAHYVYLVYEYVSGANLVNCLRNDKNPSFTVLSTWVSRMQVATDLAHGLEYIHHFSGLSVHNHIKSSSIIVTNQQECEAICAKFCHFGTAELCGEVEEARDAKLKKNKIEGTRGYMAPEFQLSGSPTHNTDVYAFGVVVLELLSGDEPLTFVVDQETGAYNRISVVDRASQAMAGGGGGVRRWVDRRLRDSFPVEVAEKMLQLGLQCVDEDPAKRPDMRQVAGLVSRLYLESKTWAERIGLPVDFSVSLAPR